MAFSRLFCKGKREIWTTFGNPLYFLELLISKISDRVQSSPTFKVWPTKQFCRPFWCTSIGLLDARLNHFITKWGMYQEREKSYGIRRKEKQCCGILGRMILLRIITWLHSLFNLYFKQYHVAGGLQYHIKYLHYLSQHGRFDMTLWLEQSASLTPTFGTSFAP